METYDQLMPALLDIQAITKAFHLLLNPPKKEVNERNWLDSRKEKEHAKKLKAKEAYDLYQELKSYKEVGKHFGVAGYTIKNRVQYWTRIKDRYYVRKDRQ